MFFELEDIDLKILSVHSLDWEHKVGSIPPKQTFSLSYRVLGDSRFSFDGGEAYAGSGSLMYFPKGIGYKLRSGREKLFVINFETEAICASDILVWQVNSTKYFENAFMEIYRVWNTKTKGFYMHAKSILYGIISKLQGELSGGHRSPHYQKLKPALDLISTDFTDPDLTVARLARETGTSETYFRRIFNELFGTSPLAYVNDLRILRAKELLTSGFYSVEQTALECGFSDTKYFSTAFKKKVGLTPTEYKNG